ncbi:MAG: hypothetical protein J7L89_00815 [Bacteroidales bacterium]|nr:hypothetical protein [Bacteroidales bacterium]
MKKVSFILVVLTGMLFSCNVHDNSEKTGKVRYIRDGETGKALIRLKYEHDSTLTYPEVIANYRKLDAAYPEAKLLEYGLTDCGKPLHLFVINCDRQFNPQKIHRSGKRIVMINNGIHPGETCGIDGSQMVADDILRNKNQLRNYLDNTVVCFIPVYNIGGYLYQNPWHRTNQPGPVNPGYRGNAKNLDLNRDFVKLDTRNAQSFVQIFRLWDPDVFLDTHTTNGSDHQYCITYLAAQHNSMPQAIGDYFEQVMMPAMYKKMRTTPYELIPYVQYVNRNPEAGITNYFQTPRFSTGYTLLFNSFTQMTENHCYKPYPDRVKSIYHFILKLIEFTHENADEMGQVRQKSKEQVKNQKVFALDYAVDTTNFRMIEFKGYDHGTDRSPLTGEVRYVYDYSKPFTRMVPFYDNFKPVKTVTAPAFYLIPQAWSEVIARMKLNEVNMYRLKKDTSLTVEVYYIENNQWPRRAGNGHFFHSRFTTRTEVQTIPYHKGDYLVPVNQDCNYFIVNQLEPEGPDSYFRWNFFDPCLENREWFSAHPVLEDKIVQYLQKNPEARQKLDAAIAENPDMAHNRTAQMHFVYYEFGLANRWVNRYPVTRVVDVPDGLL